MTRLKFVWLMAVMIVGMLSLGSCNKADDAYLPPNQEIVNRFNQLYPEARDVSWTQKGIYFVADCWVNDNELDVWFDANANWVMTETEVPLTQLPVEVSTAFENGIYAGWVIENLTKLNYPGQSPQYLFEVQRGGSQKALYYSQYGELLQEKDITNADNTHWPNITPP